MKSCYTHCAQYRKRLKGIQGRGEMALTPAQRKANEKDIKKNCDGVAIRWPRDFCDQVRAEAERQDESLEGMLIRR